MCVALLLSTTTMAQQVKTEPSAQTQRRGTKITFPPNCFTSTKNQTITIVGTTDNGVVVETDKGVKLLLNKDNTVTPLENLKSTKPPKIKIIRLELPPYRVIGTTDDGTQVWAGPDGKGCTLDVAKGTMVEYVGHVTLLK